MQRKLLFKVAVIALLSLLLLIPLAMIESQIAARSQRQDEVSRNIAESSAGAQNLVGPVLLLRYRERVDVRVKDEVSGRETLRKELVERSKVIPAQRLDVSGDIRVESLNRGIYRVRVYRLGGTLAGSVQIPPRLGEEGAPEIVDAQATLVLGIADPRGVENDPEVTVNGRALHFSTGTAGAMPGQGMHVRLGEVDPVAGASFDFALPLTLRGLEHLAIAPTANFTQVTLKSDWPHPSFRGRFLPQERSVTAQGFEARWQVSHLARNLDRILKTGSEANDGETLGVSLIDPVNVYLKSERAVKYGILFVVLTFAGFFVTEVLRSVAIHPLQYLLVGLALAIFFLLLIALSEHLDFLLAYGISASACVLLIGTYLAGALGSRSRGVAFGAGIAALYGVLYGVLLSEDNALLMGALLLFLALGVAMLSTRRLNWYQIGGGTEAAR